MKTQIMPNGNVRVEDYIACCDPDGKSSVRKVNTFWSFAQNPKDKEPERYRGEDDGWVLESIEPVE